MTNCEVHQRSYCAACVVQTYENCLSPLFLSCVALPDSIRWDHLHPSHSLGEAVSAARQPDPGSAYQHHFPGLWSVHPAAGHLRRQVRMALPTIQQSQI